MQAFARWFRRQSSWIESQQASILSAATVIAIAYIISGISGLLKNYIFVDAYANDAYAHIVDAYWVAFRIPDFVYQVVVMGALSAAFVPLFAQLYKKDKEEAFQLASQAMHLVLGSFIVLAIVLSLFARPIITLLTGGNFTGESLDIAVKMTYILMVSQILFGVSGFFSAMLQGAKRFVIPAFSPVFYNIGIAITIALAAPHLGLYAAAWGTVVGAFLHMAIQLPLLLKLGFRCLRIPRWNGKQLRSLLSLTGPRILTLAVNQLNLVAITYFATASGNLALTIINLAQSLMTQPIRFFGVSIGQAALPFLAASQDDQTGFRRTIFRSLRQIAFFATPASVLLLVLRVPIVRLAYGADRFTWRSTLTTAEALGILALSIAPQAITHLLIRAFYALNDTITPFMISLGYFCTTLLLCWVFVFQYGLGIKGIAIALALAGVLESIALFSLLLWRVRMEGFLPLLLSLGKILSAGFLMAITLFVFQRFFDLYVFETSRTLQLIQLTGIVTALGGAVYLGLCWLLRIEELTILQRIFLRLKTQWNKTIKSSSAFVEPVTAEDPTT